MPTDKAKLRELIMKAKEKLGDRNADIIAEQYGVQQWNNRSMKGLCPWHHERNPSYSYNKKDYTARCFSCGRSADVIQALMDGENLSFTAAAKKLFELAEMDVLWDKVKKDSAYRYPHEELELSHDVIDYMSKRKISEETLRKCGIQSDGKGNVVFPYYDEHDVLKLVKYRPARKIGAGENKMWSQKDADTTPILFHMNHCNPDYPLVICEGESDCLAVYEAGWHNVVSVPFGAKTVTWIDQCYDWLDQYSEIILAGDNDEPGQKMNKDAATRLGEWRCKTLEIPDQVADINTGEVKCPKDCNGVLYYSGPEYLIDLIKNAHETPIASVEDLMSVKAVDLDQLDGIETGISVLDKMIGKIYYGGVTLLTGKAAAGKSSLVASILCNAMENGVNSFIYSGELNARTNRNWIDNVFGGPRNVECTLSSKGAEFWRLKPGVSEAIGKFYRGRCYIYKDGNSSDIDALLTAAENVVRRYNCRVLVFDNLMTIMDNNEEELATQKNIMTKMVAFAVKYNVAVLLVCHLRKTPKGQQIGLEDISGSMKIGNLATLSLTLSRITDEDRDGSTTIPAEILDKDVQIRISKDRVRGVTGSCGVWFDSSCRRFYSTPEEYDRHYSFDKKVYDKPLPWPHGDVTEVIGEIDRGA